MNLIYVLVILMGFIRKLHNLPIKEVRCVETGRVYDSAADAEKATGISHNHISRCCLKRPGFKTAGGYHWEFVTNEGN